MLFRRKITTPRHLRRRLDTALRLLKTGEITELFRRSFNFFLKVSHHTRHGKKTDYLTWREKWVELNEKEKKYLNELTTQLQEKPSFLILINATNPKIPLLKATIKSLLDQPFQNWNVEIVTDLQSEKNVITFLDEFDDKRISLFKNFQPKKNLWVFQINQGDVIHEAALFAIAETVITNPAAVVVYTDNDHINSSGHFIDPFLKPDWNPDLLSGTNYFSSLVTFRDSVWNSIFSNSNNPHELAIAATNNLTDNQIFHIPHILISVYTNDDSSHRSPPFVKVDHPLPEPLPKVSILIPTKNQGKLLRRCVSSLHELTDYEEIEIIVIDHETSEKNALKFIESLKERENFLVTKFFGEFNFSAQINQASDLASGEILILLNNDTEVIQKDWLKKLVSQVSRPEIGIVGPILLFSNRTIQHAGIHPGSDGLMGHGHKHLEGNHGGYFSRLKVAHEVAAVTGACMAIEKKTWKLLGGLDEESLPVAYNDVDLCLKARKEGFRVLLVPEAKLLHHESASRGIDKEIFDNPRLIRELSIMSERWRDFLSVDPAYNPNLSFDGGSFSLASQPRALANWKIQSN